MYVRSHDGANDGSTDGSYVRSYDGSHVRSHDGNNDGNYVRRLPRCFNSSRSLLVPRCIVPGMENPFRVLDAARSVVAEVDQLLDDPKKRMLRKGQLRESSQSIAANIREGYGHRKGKGRAQFFVHARASAEETDEHLWANFKGKRIADTLFWRLHNRIAAIVKMLTKLIDREDNPGN